jgi:hypothetical protein
MRSAPAFGPSLPAAAVDAPRGDPATRIANARGVPGTLGCLALTLHERRLVLVTTHHVLFGAGAREQEPVWRLADDDAPRRIATASWGRRGIVRQDGADIHVDCAVAALHDPVGDLDDDATGVVAPGDRVTMQGGASGARAGIVVDVAHQAVARVDGRERPAPVQLLVRARDRGRPFASQGDSGAVLRDARGAIVGLLWGVTAAGDGVACPIAPVLHVLHVRPVRRGDGDGTVA